MLIPSHSSLISEERNWPPHPWHALHPTRKEKEYARMLRALCFHRGLRDRNSVRSHLPTLIPICPLDVQQKRRHWKWCIKWDRPLFFCYLLSGHRKRKAKVKVGEDGPSFQIPKYLAWWHWTHSSTFVLFSDPLFLASLFTLVVQCYSQKKEWVSCPYDKIHRPRILLIIRLWLLCH